MNAQDYIASGLLEAYVFGALSETEAAEVTLAISRFSEVAAEVAAIEEAMYEMGKAGAITPPAALQEEIWNKISASSDGLASQKQPAAKVVPLVPRQNQTAGWARAAVWVALAGSLIANFVLFNNQRDARQDYAVLAQKVAQMNASQATLNASLARYQKEAEMMANPDMKPVVMQTMQKDHPMAATIYWSKNKAEAYVSVQELPMPPKGKQYQLWAIAGGKPVDLGVLRNEMVGAKGMEKVTKAVADGQAFAISLEKEGGSPSPTMDQIFVMGKVI